MTLTIINSLILIAGIACGIKGYIVGQKSEAYDAYAWLVCGGVLAIISGLSWVSKYVADKYL